MKPISPLLLCLFLATQLYGQCFQDRHDTSLDNAWVSCTRQSNPNAIRGNSHWIVYDLGMSHNLGQTHFWNINTPGNTNMGIQEATIDYSDNFSDWTEFGSFSLEEGNESGFYEGQEGPDLSGISARYILITITENYGNVCSGFAEVKIETNGISTSTENIDLTESINLSPNPAEEFTNLKYEASIAFKTQAQLISANGAVVRSYDLRFNSGLNSHQLDVSNLASGNYSLRFNDGNKMFSGQISIINP